PSSVEEAYHLTIRAFNLAEKYMTPVVFLMDEMIAHLRETIEIDDDIEIIDRRMTDCPEGSYEPYKCDETMVPVLPPFGTGHYYNITGLTHDTWGFPTNNRPLASQLNTRIMDKIYNHGDDIEQYDEYLTEDADVLVVAYGGSARVAEAAVDSLRKKGIKAGLYRPITIWPMAETRLRELADKVDKILVVEHNYGQYVHEVERVVQGRAEVDFFGRVSGAFILPDEVVKKVEAMKDAQ
ncbi:MAG: 2-oxoacid:acceptor oxidoreductase subunit alpha, partial [Erysipelotrichaceae bacterium]|nr:2-oxoacid:acceptor oxidoreductase subunit alpha [Erysipelotrichaceae bacterium]